MTRLAPSDLGRLTADPGAVADGVPDGGGLLVQLPASAAGFTAPQELHLDALAARLAAKGAYAVLVVSPRRPPVICCKGATGCRVRRRPQGNCWSGSSYDTSRTARTRTLWAGANRSSSTRCSWTRWASCRRRCGRPRRSWSPNGWPSTCEAR
ncbi:hypothetical protein ACFQV4_14825 [Streptomyces thermocarboxydus]